MTSGSSNCCRRSRPRTSPNGSIRRGWTTSGGSRRMRSGRFPRCRISSPRWAGTRRRCSTTRSTSCCTPATVCWCWRLAAVRRHSAGRARHWPRSSSCCCRSTPNRSPGLQAVSTRCQRSSISLRSSPMSNGGRPGRRGGDGTRPHSRCSSLHSSPSRTPSRWSRRWPDTTSWCGGDRSVRRSIWCCRTCRSSR